MRIIIPLLMYLVGISSGILLALAPNQPDCYLSEQYQHQILPNEDMQELILKNEERKLK